MIVSGCYPVDLVIPVILMSAIYIQWSEGLTPMLDNSLPHGVGTKQPFVSEEHVNKACTECYPVFNIRARRFCLYHIEGSAINLCKECTSGMRANKKLVDILLTQPTKDLGKASLVSNQDSFNRFCTTYLLSDDPNDVNVCNIIGEHFLSAASNEGLPNYLNELCQTSGVCDVPDKNTTIPDGSEMNMKGHLQDAKSKQSGRLVNNDSVPRKNVDALSSNFTLFGWGRRRHSSASTPITFVQISDIHLDGYYEKGSASHCRAKICCRLNTKGSGSAGRFGDYRCDSVKETVDALMASIASLSPPPDFFVYVGDSPPHSNGRDETLDSKLSDNKNINDILRDNLRGIAPIYPTLGNHDMFPENVYFSKGRNTKKVLQALSEEWAGLFPVSDEQSDTIKEHGFYTTLVRDGLRIISMNSLYAYTLNPLSFMAVIDPSARHQYRFIKKTLETAKSNSEKVIIMSHMKPSNLNTYAAYTIAMESIVKEYQDTIVLMLYGHEHTDTFVLSTDPLNRRRATGAFLAAPSITPYIYYKLGTNPSYRVYTLEEDTFKPLDYVQYYVDLEQANENDAMEVKKHYRFTEEYNLPDLGPESFKTLAERISSDWGYYEKFQRNKDVLVKRRKQCQKWNRFCRRSLTCETTAPTKLRYRACLFNPL